MATYESDGTLVTDKKSGDSFSWDTTTEWEAYQSKTDIEITNGILQLATAIPDSGVTRYRFEQDVLDAWNGNDGTDNTSSGYVTDSKEGDYAKAYDAVDDYVDTNTRFPNLHNPTAWTMGGYLRWTDTSERVYMGFADNSANSRESLFINFAGGSDTSPSAGDVGIRYRHSSAYLIWGTDGRSLDDGNWHHVVFGIGDVSSNTVKCWIDGSPDTTISVDQSPGDFDPSYNFYLGANNEDGSPNSHSPADEDDFRVYDKLLSDTEVSNWYSTGSISG